MSTRHFRFSLGEVAPSKARLRELACLAYGSESTGAESLVQDDLLTPQEARSCGARYNAAQLRWIQFLAPYLEG